MSTIFRRGLVAAALVGSALAMGCSHMGEKTASQVVEDATITSKVKARFVADPVVSAMNVKVEAFKGVVQLSGFANSVDEARRAEQIARETSGVQTVKNDIRLAAR